MDLQARLVTSRAAILLFMFALYLAVVSAAFAQTETILYSFCAQSHCVDGELPEAGLLLDAAGNLYGTTGFGGEYGYGTVFKLAPDGTETVLHSFNVDDIDGAYPQAGVIEDKNGNLYGTTVSGGTTGVGGHVGLGTVFKLSPKGSETILHSFGIGRDGQYPTGGLILVQGNLFGTTSAGGNGNGTVFRIQPDGTENILFSFPNTDDGQFPHTSLLMDAAGNFYSTTEDGGANGQGCIFELGSGKETVLHSFAHNGTDGFEPRGQLLRDSQGNLYGTTAGGGTGNAGAVYEIARDGTETILHSFGSDPDGTFPDYAGVVMDSAGNLYGTTAAGGTNGSGVVYELSANGAETILHQFGGSRADGDTPVAGLIRDAKGNLYGTASAGGIYGGGVIFKITP